MIIDMLIHCWKIVINANVVDIEVNIMKRQSPLHKVILLEATILLISSEWWYSGRVQTIIINQHYSGDFFFVIYEELTLQSQLQ